MIKIKDFETASHGWRKMTLYIENTATKEVFPLEIDTPKGTYVGGYLTESFRYNILGRIRFMALRKWPSAPFDKGIIISGLTRLDY